jgi:hypothetical protein
MATAATPTRRYTLLRPPINDDELHDLVQAMWGIDIPRKKVCPDHVAPFTAFANAYFSRAPNHAVWYGSRGTGKSLLLAVLGMTKALTIGVDITILGGSMAQSANVHEHNRNLLDYPDAPSWALRKVIDTEILTEHNAYIRPLPASPTTVRGPHPNTTLLDEVDEMEWTIYNSAQGQAMEKEPGGLGVSFPEYLVASSTWQHVNGTFTKVLAEARAKGLPIYSWCYREVLKPHGWMEPAFIERKRHSVPSEMFRVEYELGEPSGETSAFDVTKIKPYFVPMTPIDERHADGDDEYIYAEPVTDARYAAGADWAKSVDYTAISVVRIDVPQPHPLVYFRKVRRRSWPTMIGYFNETVNRYNQASSAHDATGLGSVVHDLVDERTIKVVMTREKRMPLLTEYITDLEQGRYLMPDHLFDDHKGTTSDAVYGGTQKDHIPDPVVSLAMARRAHDRGDVSLGDNYDPLNKDPHNFPAWIKAIDYVNVDGDSTVVSRQGDVTILDVDSEVGVLWLP